jgi:hypothetical protein
MKAKQKQVGTKAQIRDKKERERRIAIFLAFIALVIIVSAYFTHMFPNQTINPASSQPKAAIVDQLSLTMPNQTFIETATATLEQAGYTVDYYEGEKVTVEFYRNLPTHGYRLIILRAHSALGGERKPPLAIFSSEPYNKMEHVPEQIAGQLVKVRFQPYQEGDPAYFGIFPNFVRSSMNGRFENTIIIMMGCDGLTDADMAKAFVEKGAKGYISWFGPVSASHTDTTTTQLLQHFLIEKLTLKQSVQETFKQVGFDPTYTSLLIYYPLEAGDQTIEDFRGNPTTKP